MIDNQTTIFDMLYPKKKITKPIRLIECFAGYGSQALALKYLGVPFEHWKTCEWAIKSIQAYKDIHFTNEYHPYGFMEETKEDLVNYLYKLGISSNYNEPMTLEQIKRLKHEDLCTICENIYITNNLVNIQQVKGEDLEIVDTDKYEYIMTYSFPCQDLSLAGKGKGMSDTTTRSGMLWEVERILTECYELGNMPQILLMENVQQVHSQDNLEDFNKWKYRLEELGYKNYFQDLIATDYGIPQTRNRCFMISLLGDYSYTFPKPIPLKLKLKDMLEDNVNEKYYLSEKGMQYICGNALNKELKDHIDRSKAKLNKEIAYTINTKQDRRCGDANFILDGYGETTIEQFLKIKNATAKGYLEATDGDGIDISSRMEYHRGNVQKDKIQTLTTSGGNDRGVVVDNSNIYNLFSKVFDLCNVIDTKEKDKYERSRKLLQILWEEIVGKEEILQSNLYENGVYENRELQSKISPSTSNSGKHNGNITSREKVFDMWENWKTRYTPQRWELSEQQFRQFNLFMQELSYETTQRETSMQDMWQTNERFRILQQTLFKIQEIWRPIENKISNGLRIRKLSPRECWRLMGVKDEDFDKVKQNQSDSSLYHLAGDSIVVNVLMAIFKEML